jgi:hypothetical protein
MLDPGLATVSQSSVGFDATACLPDFAFLYRPAAPTVMQQTLDATD